MAKSKTSKLLNNPRVLVWGNQGVTIQYTNVSHFTLKNLGNFFLLPVTAQGDNLKDS